MSGEQQLERSVLEGKERDELHAIAEALGLKPSSRAAKATLVGQILRATGVEEDAGAPPAARARATRSRAAGPDANGTSGATDETAAADEPAAAGTPPGGDSGADPGSWAAGDGPPADASGDADDGADASADGGADRAPGADPVHHDPVDGDVRSPARPDDDDNDNADAAADQQTHNAAAGDPSGPGSRDQGQWRDQGRDRGNGQSQYQPGAQGGQGPHGGSTGQAGQHNNLDPANRRSRRRRGRDRSDRPGEVQSPAPAHDQPFSGEPVPVSGLLDLNDQGYGFLRTSGYIAGPRDVYVSISQVRRFALRKGDQVEGASRPAGSSEKYPALVRIDTVSGLTPDEARQRPRFEDLTPLFPDDKLRLEVPGDQSNMVSRIVDLISPIGKGQRGLIVSPPKAGKTTVLKQIAHSIEANNPEVHLMVLLVDERPEEVTDMRRSVQGEVVASTFDRPSDEHTAVAELAIDRAKRLVELGKDVVIVLDGITRLARAYNLAAPASGRILSGGVDANALYPPKRFFGAARNIEEGGSLTILATALVETGSRMDEVIFEEFKGTGNMELRLDRRLAERRIYPAIDVNGSSTRHEELLFERVQLQQVWKLRRVLQALGAEGSHAAGLELLMEKIKTTKSNDEFLAEIAKGPAVPV
ncbi:MAG TPA: transcription termination factor Rho [Acidimicrobiales bacterium]|nr:transcription termination factor Rho [Acidimicrobiales bacterium]